MSDVDGRHVRFLQLAEAPGMTSAAIAAEAGCSPGHVDHVRGGRRRATDCLIAAAERALAQQLQRGIRVFVGGEPDGP